MIHDKLYIRSVKEFSCVLTLEYVKLHEPSCKFFIYLLDHQEMPILSQTSSGISPFRLRIATFGSLCFNLQILYLNNFSRDWL